MSAGFTGQLRTSDKLKEELDSLNLTVTADLTKLVKLLWAEKYNLPPNDERLLSLTLREAAEQVFAQNAVREYLREKQERIESHSHVDPYDFSSQPEVKTAKGEKARKLADRPHLTGDPEFDAIELAETDPTRAPLSERLLA